jgi:hypothetical protein
LPDFHASYQYAISTLHLEAHGSTSLGKVPGLYGSIHFELRGLLSLLTFLAFSHDPCSNVLRRFIPQVPSFADSLTDILYQTPAKKNSGRSGKSANH